MRVLVDTSYRARGRSGTAVYIEELTRALRARGNVDLVEVSQRRRLAPGRAGGPAGTVRSAVNAALDFAWLRVGLPRAARLTVTDVVHHPLPALSPAAACAQVVTVHDVAFELFPEGYGRVWRRLAGRSHRSALRRADGVVAVSEGTAREAVRVLGAPPDAVVVAPHGPGQDLAPVAAGQGEPTHFLYLGSDEPRKDVSGLLDAYARYRESATGHPLGLVLAGQAARRAAPGVVGEPDPGPADLTRLMRGAAALVHPSPYEGFGLTLLEAMSAGVPVVARRSAAAEEVCGDAALLVERDELAPALSRVASDAALRSDLSERGRERSASFSWEASAQAHERCYELALARHESRGR